MKKDDIEILEEKISYTFKDKNLLIRLSVMRDYVNYQPPKPEVITLGKGLKIFFIGLENFLLARY